MRIAILGDVHANLEALDAVISHARGKGVSYWIQVGDVVGYGPDPGACISRLQDLDATVVAGNHDLACCGKLDTSGFNDAAREAADWTTHVLSFEQQSWLSSLPLKVVTDHPIAVFHATWTEPRLFQYLTSPELAANELGDLPHSIGCCGHTHLPMQFSLSPSLSRSTRRSTYLKPLLPTILNPGSVGQPRDGDPRAAYAVLDLTEYTYTLYRCPYDIEAVQGKILRAGLPVSLANRLALGQ